MNSKALLIIGSFFSLLIMSGLMQKYLGEIRREDPKYQVHFIKNGGGLPDAYVYELLEVEMDQPIHRYRFSCQEACQKLLSSPFLSQADVQFDDESLLLSYQFREPVGRLGGIDSALVDAEGVVFPSAPFLEKDTLPLLTLGEQKVEKWGDRVQQESLDLALEVVKALGVPVLAVDVSRRESASYAKRELVVSAIPPGRSQLFLRLHPKEWRTSIENFQRIYASGKIPEEVTWIDLRFSDMAFAQRG